MTQKKTRKTKSNRGGARPGAGRPKGPEKIMFTAEILPGSKTWIEADAEILGISQGAVIDRLIELHKASTR